MSQRKLSILLLALLVAGCGSSETRRVTGTVTFNGEPLPHGTIEFKPITPTDGSLAGAVIADGQYEVPSIAQGLKGGVTYCVEITSLKSSGRFAPDPTNPSGRREVLENFIPAQYNESSELRVTVEDDPSRNVFNFQLGRKVPPAK